MLCYVKICFTMVFVWNIFWDFWASFLCNKLALVPSQFILSTSFTLFTNCRNPSYNPQSQSGTYYHPNSNHSYSIFQPPISMSNQQCYSLLSNQESNPNVSIHFICKILAHYFCQLSNLCRVGLLVVDWIFLLHCP